MAAPDWRALLEKSITHDAENLERLRSYVFGMEDENREMRMGRTIQTYEVNLVGPGMYIRHTRDNGKPLEGEMAQREASRLAQHLSLKHEALKDPQWLTERQVLANWLRLHTFRYKGTKQHAGREALLIESSPPKEPLDVDLAFLTYCDTRILLDAETGHWLEARFEPRRSFPFALNQLLLGRLSLPYSPGLINRAVMVPDAILSFHLERNADGLWVPVWYRTQGRNFQSNLTFRNFRRFSTESQLKVDE